MDLHAMPDQELFSRLENLRAEEESLLVEFLGYLGEVDRRRAALLERGYSSTFDYCVRRLGLSGDETMRRINAARAARLHPQVLSYLKGGVSNLTNIAIVGPHLTTKNVDQILERAAGKPTREVQRIAAELQPEPDKPDRVAPADSAAPVYDRMKPSAPGRVHISFTASEEVERLIERAKDILWHKFPFGRIEDVLTEALREFVQRRERNPGSKPSAGRPAREAQTRTPPKWVRDKVWVRDGGRCSFVASNGWRCEATRSLEFDHIKPWALGGTSDDPSNIRLLCRGHNQLRAREMLG